MFVYCQKCENRCSDAAEACPKCGHPLCASPGGVSSAPPNEDVASATTQVKSRMISELAGVEQPRERVVYVTQPREPTREWSPGVAAALSFLIPGLGQIYKGHILNGLAWLVVVAIGYIAFIVPGLILHVCCIFWAARGSPYK